MNKEWLEAENDLLKKRVYEGNQIEKSYVKYLETYKQALLDIKEYIEQHIYYDDDLEQECTNMIFNLKEQKEILDIVNKALGDKE